MLKFMPVLVFALAMLVPMAAYAQDTSIPIIFINTVDNIITSGEQLPEILLAPAGYTNSTTVTTAAEFIAAVPTLEARSVIIVAYHNIMNDPDLLAGLQLLEPWIQGGGIFISTVGRDADAEMPLADMFGLSVDTTNTGVMEAIVPVNAPFDTDIAGGQMDSTSSADNTPTNGEVYADPLPAWVEHVVTTNLAGATTSVVGHYGAGAMWAGAGFELSNIGTGTDLDQSTFTGFKQLWKNVLDWLTTPGAAVEPASKLVTTWGAIRDAY